MKERDKYLTEAMGECWHEYKKTNSPRVTIDDRDLCLVCNNRISLDHNNPNFSTWEGFGKLFGWASIQDWWEEPDSHYYEVLPDKYINPDKFADAIYRFLKYEEASSESSNISG